MGIEYGIGGGKKPRWSFETAPTKKRKKRKNNTNGNKFKHCEAIFWEPKWYREYVKSFRLEGLEPPIHPLKYGELVYFLGEIPNVLGHCIVAKYTGEVVPMVHPEDFRKAKDEEL